MHEIVSIYILQKMHIIQLCLIKYANVLRILIFWDVILYCWMDGSQQHKGSWCLHLLRAKQSSWIA